MRRRQHRNRLIRLFCTVLGGVLAVGALFLVILHFMMPQQELLVYEFFHLPTETLTQIFSDDTQQEEGQADEAVTLLFAGDVLFDDNYAVMATYHSRGDTIANAFDEALLEQMNAADIFMLNNEFTFTDRGTPTSGKQFTFRSQPSNVSLYGKMGVDIVSVANNHSYDYGEDSLLDTLDTLSDAGISYVGAGRNLEEAMTPVYYERGGMTIAFVSATQIEKTAVPDTKEATADSAGVLRCMDTANLLSVIAEAEAKADFTVLYIHWGTESTAETDWLQEEQAPIYAEAGVDLIIGDHPHCLQRIDGVSGVPVIYSLGNFWFNSKTQDSCMVEVTLADGELTSFQFIPCRQSDCRTTLLTGDDKTDVISYMRSISPNVTIDDNGMVTF